MKKEFDQYIDRYRSNCDECLKLSGETSAFFAEYKAQKLAEWLPEQAKQPCKILDFGCGDGLMTHFVQKAFPKGEVFGVDPSPKSIEAAQHAFPEIAFSLSSEEKIALGFEDHYFDIVFSAGVFHHIPFENHVAYLDELARILKPKGHLVLFELNPLNPLTILTFKRNPIDRHAKMMPPWYTHRLTRKYGKSKTKFYCFYPNFLKWMRGSEPYLTQLPFGALYATITVSQFSKHTDSKKA